MGKASPLPDWMRAAVAWVHLGLIAALFLPLTGCSGVSRTAAPLTPSEVSRPAQPSASGPTGTVTWKSIESPVPLCGFITSQVGSTYPLWLDLTPGDGPSITITMSHEGPIAGGDPLADPPGVFVGTRTENSVEASYTGPFGGLACNGFSAGMTGGRLSATVSGNRIAGQYTEEYGDVKFVFTFDSAL